MDKVIKEVAGFDRDVKVQVFEGELVGAGRGIEVNEGGAGG